MASSNSICYRHLCMYFDECTKLNKYMFKHCYIQFHCDEFLSLSLYSGIKIVATKCIQIASDCRYERTYQHAPEELHNRKVMNIKHVMHHKVVCNNNNILQILPYMLNLMPL